MRGRIRRLSVGATMLLASAGGVQAVAPVVAEQSWQHGDWAAHRILDPDGNRLFCALESRSDGTLFRISRYTDDKDTYAQLSNPAWTFSPVEARIRLDFALEGATTYQANLSGITRGNKYLFGLGDEARYQTILALISKTTAIDVVDPNGAFIAKFSGAGQQAISLFAGKPDPNHAIRKLP
jgi:hypothetical protein